MYISSCFYISYDIPVYFLQAALRHLPLTQLKALRHEHGTPRLPQLHARLALQGMALRQLESIQPELHAAINGLQRALATYRTPPDGLKKVP